MLNLFALLHLAFSRAFIMIKEALVLIACLATVQGIATPTDKGIVTLYVHLTKIRRDTQQIVVLRWSLVQASAFV